MAQLDPLRGLYATQPVQPVAAPSTTSINAPAKTDADGKTFQDLLTDFVKQVDQSQHDVDTAINAVTKGDVDSLHRAMLAQSQAQLSLKLAVEVRNKLVDAYKEVNRLQF